MAAIIRFFSRRFGRKKDELPPSHVDDEVRYNKTKKNKKSDLECRVTYLDGTEQTFYLPVSVLPLTHPSGIRKKRKPESSTIFRLLTLALMKKKTILD